MDVFAIPVDDKFVLYRPLRRLAFAGNGAMARLVLAGSTADLPPAVAEFLEGIGFLAPDPAPPASPDGTYRPTTAVLLLTSRCNLRCIYCYANAGEEAVEDMPLAVARATIDYVYANAVELGRSGFELTFHGGGEPVAAWSTLRAAVAYARTRDRPCHVSAVTNGLWSEREQAWLIDNLDSLTISCDGTAATQNRQRPRASGRGSFDGVMKTIAALDRRGKSYGIRLTALAPWREQLPRDVAFICRETGCRSMQVEPAFNTARGEYRPPCAAESAEFAAGFMAAHEIAARAGRQLTYSGARPWTLTSLFCTAPYSALVVTPTGRLVTCYEVAGPRHPLAEALTFGCIEPGGVRVDDRRRTALLERLAARREACRDCFCYWHCAGDCHAKAFHPESEPSPSASVRCQMNRSITAQLLLSYIAGTPDGVWRGEQKRAAG